MEQKTYRVIIKFKDKENSYGRITVNTNNKTLITEYINSKYPGQNVSIYTIKNLGTYIKLVQ